MARLLSPAISSSLSRPLPVLAAIPSCTSQLSTSAPSPPIKDARFLTTTKARIGRCMTFGLPSEYMGEATVILRELAQDWRELVAGSEGFLTSKRMSGLFRQKVVWGEMSARINWAYNFAIHLDPGHRREWSDMWTPKGHGLILRSMRTDFKFPMAWPDHVTVLHKLRSMPDRSTDSFVLDVIILSERHQRPAARCEEDIVVYDYRQGRKATLQPFMVNKFQEVFQWQEEAKQKNSKRVQGLLSRVRALEKASWDRVDAKEDFGDQ
ncbi:MAG: hypothetical protein M1834_002829 [Cirrosporium novae-zelandiae]|nr:MAG: hypothetical protein M1834_002829 [Cirrosporium novae-zelandiae]